MKQLTTKETIELYESEKWKDWPDRALVGFQLFQEKLCVPFDVFHEKLEKVLDRAVWTHELGLNYDGIIAEYLGETSKPSFEDIMNLIPEEKRMIVSV